ncbi:MAG TPA: response regulator transcription factor [Ktedonobacteraceae bacterium]|nr:response regulator transcription factor [Ktedonobacteraceae bacterium]
MKQILVVEDEGDLASALRRGLTYKGFAVQVASSGQTALEQIRRCRQDLVLLDVMLPDMDGFELCRRLRSRSEQAFPFPILMLTARDAIRDKITGLESGADDYITKPFDFEELVAHIRAGLRRVKATPPSTHTLVAAGVILDMSARQAWRDGQLLELTKREYDLLELLVRNAGHVLTKGCIFERVWGDESEAGLEVIKVYINYLRAKLNAGGKPNLLHAVRCVGYVFRE